MFLNLAWLALVFAPVPASPVDNLVDLRYHSNKEIEWVLKNLSAVSDPVRTSLYNIGKTPGGNTLWVLSLTASPEGKIGVPNVKLIGNMHGDEAVGRVILLKFIENLLKNYGVDQTTTQLLNTTVIHVMPTLNPDGFDRSKEAQCASREGREIVYKKKMVDLNRNFPDPFFDKSTKNGAESDAIIRWMENNTFILSAALHGGALVANYPFDSAKETYSKGQPPSLTPDNDVFVFLARNYSQTHKSMHLGQGCTSPDGEVSRFDGGITNGAEWYTFEGGMGDYNYAFHGCMELTLELSCCKYPPTKDLPRYWDENKDALLALCIQANRGVSGQILDYDTNTPITGANLSIVGRDVKFWSARNTGEFWRILLPGSYELKVEVTGYLTKVIKFTVQDYKDAFPIPTFLEVHVQNASIYTEPTTVPTTEKTFTSPMIVKTSKSFKDILTRSNFEEIKKTEPVLQMSRSCGFKISLSMIVITGYLLLNFTI